MDIKDKFLKLLDNYTFCYIDELLSDYLFIKNNTDNELNILTNKICKVIMKHNLEMFYNNIEKQKYKFVINIPDKTDTLFAEYNMGTKTTVVEHLYRWGFKYLLKKYIIKEFEFFCKKIDFNKRTSRFLRYNNSEYFTDFESLFELFQNMHLNNQDMLDFTLYIMTTNLNKGILNKEEQNPVMKAHQLISDNYYGMANLDASQINPIIEALECLNYPNTDIAWVVLNKRIEKYEMLRDSKSLSGDAPNNKETAIIDKALYFEGMELISKYYNVEKDTLTKRLSVNEIVYVVGIMQSLNFDDVVLNKFLKTAYKKHKSLSPIDRYLDLSNKIAYYIEIDDVKAIDKTLKEILREYTLASNDTNKAFWLNSLDEELRSLDSIINDDYTYELTKNKSQE